MSLLTEAMDDCVMLNKISADDGYGGMIYKWTEGAHFKAAVVFDTSIEARIADAQGVKSVYTVTTARNITLEYHDVFKRLRDNKIIRVTSDGDDKYTPNSATLDMRQVTAEEFTLEQNNG